MIWHGWQEHMTCENLVQSSSLFFFSSQLHVEIAIMTFCVCVISFNFCMYGLARWWNGGLGRCADRCRCLSAVSVYQERERERFAVLESKARSDKNVMMARLLHAAYVGVSESLCDAMVESPVGSLVQPVSQMLLPGLTMSQCAYIFHIPFCHQSRPCSCSY